MSKDNKNWSDLKKGLPMDEQMRFTLFRVKGVKEQAPKIVQSKKPTNI